MFINRNRLMCQLSRLYEKLLIFIFLIIALIGCEVINEDDYMQLLPDMEGNTFQSTVLVEEYTGQKCINCPDAAKLLQGQKKILGNHLIVVSMHAPRTGLTKPNLANQEADTYAMYYEHPRAVPGVMINRERMGENWYSQNQSLWISELRRQAMTKMPCKISIQQVKFLGENEGSDSFSTAINTSIAVDLLVSANKEFKSQLGVQLWAVEDIITEQMTALGNISDYFHHNVFRGSLNGTWGEPAMIGEVMHREATLPTSIKDLSSSKVVAFVFDMKTKYIYDASIFSLGKGIQDNKVDKESVETDYPKQETLSFKVNNEFFKTGTEFISSEATLITPSDFEHEMISPAVFVVPGTSYGEGEYLIKVSKVDHMGNKDCGLSSVCYNGNCIMSKSEESHTGKFMVDGNISDANQTIQIHYMVKNSLAKVKDDYTIKVALYKSEKEIASYRLLFKFSPAQGTIPSPETDPESGETEEGQNSGDGSIEPPYIPSDGYKDVECRALAIDFSGQFCHACPLKLRGLQNDKGQYGSKFDYVVMHPNYWGSRELMNDDAMKYFSYLASINRIREEFPTVVYNSLGSHRNGDFTWDSMNTISPLAFKTSFRQSNKQISVTFSAKKRSVESNVDKRPLKVVMWILQDEIKARQNVGSSGYKSDYIHYHVMRGSLNGVWGSDYQLESTYSIRNQDLPEDVYGSPVRDYQNPPSKKLILAILVIDSESHQIYGSAQYPFDLN